MRPSFNVVGAVALMLSGCTPWHAAEQAFVTKMVDVPVWQPCVVKPDPRPAFPDTKEALTVLDGKIDQQVALLLAGRTLRDPYINELEHVVHACQPKTNDQAPTPPH